MASTFFDAVVCDKKEVELGNLLVEWTDALVGRLHLSRKKLF